MRFGSCSIDIYEEFPSRYGKDGLIIFYEVAVLSNYAQTKKTNQPGVYLEPVCLMGLKVKWYIIKSDIHFHRITVIGLTKPHPTLHCIVYPTLHEIIYLGAGA